MNRSSRQMSFVFAAVLLATLSPAGAQEERPWEHPAGPACFEQWIGIALGRINGYVGPEEAFLSHKPYRMSPYGSIIGTNASQNQPPDNWSRFGANKYWWMWAHYKHGRSTWDLSQARGRAWQAAGVPLLRPYIQDCIAGREPRTKTCPERFYKFRYQDGYRLRCYCPPERMVGRLWGTFVYTDDSSICAAARHAGACPAGGGEVEILGRPPVANFTGTTRNGITSTSYSRPVEWAFCFPALGRGCPGDPAPPNDDDDPEDGSLLQNTNLPLNDIGSLRGWEMCRRICELTPECRAWTWVKPGVQGPGGVCWLKGSVPQTREPNPDCVSGIKSGG